MSEDSRLGASAAVHSRLPSSESLLDARAFFLVAARVALVRRLVKESAPASGPPVDECRARAWLSSLKAYNSRIGIQVLVALTSA